MSDDNLEMFKDVLEALKQMAAALTQLETRVKIIEYRCFNISEWEKIMLDLGFRK
jgi:hypothetical protein